MNLRIAPCRDYHDITALGRQPEPALERETGAGLEIFVSEAISHEDKASRSNGRIRLITRSDKVKLQEYYHANKARGNMGFNQRIYFAVE